MFSKIWEIHNSKQKQNKKHWIVCDGPVDTIWIESLNTVLDDNKILTLPNGDRFPMAENVKLIFEVENLNNASPATVSRCGIVYVSLKDLGYKAILKTWYNQRKRKDASVIYELLLKYLCTGKNSLFKEVDKNLQDPIL